MCGRVVQSSPVEVIRAEFRAATAEPIRVAPRYNVAPEQDVLAVTATEDGRRLRLLRWGLVPFYAKERKRGPRSINARSETVATKAPFRDLLVRRRCVVPADGFYEWQGEGAARTPYLVRSREGRLLALAGLWDRWRRPDEPVLETFTILTCESNALVRDIHDRMPVILSPEAVESWLDPGLADPEVLVSLLRPSPATGLEAWPVSRAVNSPRNEGPELVRPVSTAPLRVPVQTSLPLGDPPRRKPT